MNAQKIYPPFLERINNQIKNQILKSIGQDDIPDKEEEFRVIISFENISDRDNFILKNKNIEILKNFDLIPAINLKLTRERIHDLEKEELIKKIEEDQKLYLSMIDVIENLGLNPYRKSQISYTGKDIVVGIVDNGINRDFDTISDVISNQFSLKEGTIRTKEKITKKEITHGTLMANIIGNQYLDNNNNIIGIAPDVKIIDLDISNLKEEYYISSVLEIFDIITKNNIRFDLLLVSLTTLNPSDGKDILSLACNLLVDKGIIIVCPAGNFGPESYTIGSPSAAENVISIGALTKEMTIAYYSGRGPTLDDRIKPDFCLPGSKIEIPLSDKIRVKISGTSVAAAIGVGLIALLKEFNPNLSHKETLEIIKEASIDLNYQKISQGCGTTNFLDVFKQLSLFQEGRFLPYNYLIKNSLMFSIGFILVLIFIFYLFHFLNLMQYF